MAKLVRYPLLVESKLHIESFSSVVKSAGNSTMYLKDSIPDVLCNEINTNSFRSMLEKGLESGELHLSKFEMHLSSTYYEKERSSVLKYSAREVTFQMTTAHLATYTVKY